MREREECSAGDEEIPTHQWTESLIGFHIDKQYRKGDPGRQDDRNHDGNILAWFGWDPYQWKSIVKGVHSSKTTLCLKDWHNSINKWQILLNKRKWKNLSVNIELNKQFENIWWNEVYDESFAVLKYKWFHFWIKERFAGVSESKIFTSCHYDNSCIIFIVQTSKSNVLVRQSWRESVHEWVWES